MTAAHLLQARGLGAGYGDSTVLRDLDLLVPLAEQRLVSVSVSLTTLDDELKRIMEPRAASPSARLRVLRTLHEAGVPVNRWTTTGFLAASATTNETAWLTYKTVRSMGIVGFDNQARV